MSVLTYSAGGHPDYHKSDSRCEFPRDQKTYGGSWDLVATDLAHDYYCNHDGWEDSWPVHFRIYRDDIEVARFDVNMEMEPSFYAHEADDDPAPLPNATGGR